MDPITMLFLTLITFCFLFGMVSYVQVVASLRAWQSELKDIELTGGETYRRHSWITKLLDEYEQFRLSGIELVNTQALIEKHFFNNHVRLFGILRTPMGNVIKILGQLPSASIILGILGTFIGLTFALFSMQETLAMLGNSSAQQVTVNSIIASIASPFQGMSLAFMTSIAGIISALLLTFVLNGFFNGGKSISYLQSEILSITESLLDHNVAAKLSKEKPRDYLEKIFDRFTEKVQESFQQSVGHFSTEMIRFTSGLEEAMQEVNQILQTQRTVSEAFASSAESLHQFGDRLTDTSNQFSALKSDTERMISQLGDRLHSFESQFKVHNEKTEAGSKRMEQVISRSDQLMKQMDQKTHELATMFLKSFEEQMQRAGDRQEELERRMLQLNEDWFHRYQDKQERYHQATQDFASSTQRMEKAWYDTIERIKRDVFERFERERQMNQRRGPHDSQMELLRSLELFQDRFSKESMQIQQYLHDLQQLLYRMLEQQMQQGNKDRHLVRRPVQGALPE